MHHKLTEEQLTFLNRFLNGKDNLFLTGGAGTGKSFLIGEFIKAADAKNQRCTVLTPTGVSREVANSFLRGMQLQKPIQAETLHSFFHIADARKKEVAIANSKTHSDRLTAKLKVTDIIIIDEISMVSDWIFSVIEEICRTYSSSEQLWGGKRIIVVGDFLQLPPVSDDFENRQISKFCFFDQIWEKSQFITCLLTQTMRTAHPEFINILHKVRSGQAAGDSDQAVKDFLTKKICQTIPDYSVIRLMSKNKTVDEINSDALNKIFSQRHTFLTKYLSGKDSHQTQINDEETLRFLKDKFPIDAKLTLKVGARIMMRYNDRNRRWVNGSLGLVVSCCEQNQTLRIRLDGDKVEHEVAIETFEFKDSDGKTLAYAIGMPCILAWAISIHKSQGLSLDRAFIDLQDNFACGQAYVALSRLRSPDGLFLSHYDLSSILTDPNALQFYQNLRDGEIAKSVQEENPRDFQYGRVYSEDTVKKITKWDEEKKSIKGFCFIQNNKIFYIKGSTRKNPYLESKFTLWIEGDDQHEKNRSEALDFIISSKYSFPIFIVLTKGVLKFHGYFSYNNHTIDKREIQKEIGQHKTHSIFAIVRFSRVEQRFTTKDNQS